MQTTDKIWMDGKLVDWDSAKIHILTHALHYGTAVFEGIRCYNTIKGAAIFRLKDHMTRFLNSAKFYHMKVPYSSKELCQAVKDTIKINKINECYIRPIAFYAYGEIGLFPLKNPVSVAVAVWPWGTYLGEEGLKKGIRCKVSSWLRIDSRMLPPQAKCSANYANSALAKIEALDCGYDEAILLNLSGHVSEGPGENIFIVKDSILITPPTSSGALAGLTKDSVVEIAKDFGFTCIEGDILRDELFTADEAFLTGTAAEVTPIREVDGRIIGSGYRGPITEKLQTKFFEVVKGEDDKYAKWLELV